MYHEHELGLGPSAPGLHLHTPKTHTGEEVTGVQVDPALWPVKQDSEDWLSGLESRADLRATVVPLAL